MEVYTDRECISYLAKTDTINHPSHYVNGNRETIDTIKDVTGEGFQGYLVGNILKYISRYKFKNGTEDLKKAQWYIEKLIQEQKV
jgi:hypothetical protein